MLRRQKLKPAMAHLALYAAMLVVLAVTVSGCSTAIKPAPVVAVKLVQPAVPNAAKVPCKAPVQLPDKDLSEREATLFWAGDRAALKECEVRRRSAVAVLDVPPLGGGVGLNVPPFNGVDGLETKNE